MKNLSQAGLAFLLIMAVGAGVWFNRTAWRHRRLMWQLQAAVSRLVKRMSFRCWPVIAGCHSDVIGSAIGFTQIAVNKCALGGDGFEVNGLQIH